MQEEIETRIRLLRLTIEDPYLDSSVRIDARDKLQILEKFYDAMYGMSVF